MIAKAHVFIATSLDGYIADPDGGVEWLSTLPVIEGEDHGYAGFMAGVDALLMGGGTYRAVLGFGDWPYTLPVVVLSTHLTQTDVPDALQGRVRILGVTPRAALETLAGEGARRVYLDGGQLITSALQDGLVQRLTITRVPVLLGRGLPLFGDTGPQRLHHVETRSWPNGFVQSTYEVLPLEG